MNTQHNPHLLNWWSEPSPIVRSLAWMNGCARFFRERTAKVAVLFALAVLIVADASAEDHMARHNVIEGSWTLVFADVLHPDGSRSPDYGNQPKGSLQVDGEGRYSLFILDGTRIPFAGKDKKTATDPEIRAAYLGVSAHYGRINVDAARHALDFDIEGSSYPNWEGTAQTRQFELEGDLLTYRVPARPNGDVPMTRWKRVWTSSGKP